MRGEQTTRIETFTDAAFAFALTMLVISIETIPQNYTELVTALKGIPAFAASFALIVMFWHAHNIWSRKYGLEDMGTTILSALLIFIVMVFIYPLKLIFGGMFHWLSRGWLTSPFDASIPELTNLFIIYGCAFAVMSLAIILLYVHAWRKRDLLELNQLETFDTKMNILAWLILFSTGVANALLAWLLPQQISYLSMFSYAALGIIMPIFGIVSQKAGDKLLSQSKRACG